MQGIIKCSVCATEMGRLEKLQIEQSDYDFAQNNMACDCGNPGVLTVIEEVPEAQVAVEPANEAESLSFVEKYKTQLIIGGMAAGAAALAAYLA